MYRIIGSIASIDVEIHSPKEDTTTKIVETLAGRLQCSNLNVLWNILNIENSATHKVVLIRLTGTVSSIMASQERLQKLQRFIK